MDDNTLEMVYISCYKMLIMKKLLCKIGLHDWEITKWSRFRDKKHSRNLVEEGFDRECEQCEKRQRLEKPVEYHPTKYVWTNIL